MIERHISFAVLADKTTDFERFFVEDYRPPVLLLPGLIECSLLREAERPDRYQMVFRWETAEHAAAWRTSEAHVALQPTLSSLHAGMEIVAFAKVA